MKISAIWSLFSSKNVANKRFKNPYFNFLVEFETRDFEIKNRYYKKNNDNSFTEVSKYDIPQPQFSAMLQSDDWSEK